MIPETVELIGRRNAPFIEEYVFTESGVPVDFTGCTATMQLRRYANEPGTALLSLANVTSDVEGVWISDHVNGVMQVRIDKASLSALPDRSTTESKLAFAYDLHILWPDGLEEVLLEGSFVLKPGVTR